MANTTDMMDQYEKSRNHSRVIDSATVDQFAKIDKKHLYNRIDLFFFIHQNWIRKTVWSVSNMIQREQHFQNKVSRQKLE